MEEMKVKYKSNLAITLWEEEERPREKLALLGKNSLTMTELLAIIIGTGNKKYNAVELARNILHLYPPDRLPFLRIADLCEFQGIGKAKAVSIISALELGKRCSISTKTIREELITSSDAYHYLRNTFDNLDHEQFWVVFLNSNCTVIAKEMISKGGLNQTVVDPIVVMKKIIGHMAKGVILAHNHPSGNLNVSRADRNITRKIAEICKLLHVNVLDHIIFSERGYTSFADEGLLEK